MPKAKKPSSSQDTPRSKNAAQPQAAKRKPAAPASDLPEKRFADASALRVWLEAHHALASGIWMVFAKKGVRPATVTYAEAVEEALCFGWIDGQKQKRDETTYRLRFTPRGKRSIWSQVNRDKVEALEKTGRMHPAGRAAAQAAKADGRWDAAYAPASKSTVPPDLMAALHAHPQAETFFAGLKSASRYAILFRLQTVKKPETRARKLTEFIAMLERGEAPHLI